jgi:hypothetical protein
LLAVLALSLGLNAWGLRYGLPNVYTWAQDEIIPAEVLDGLERRFSDGWHSRYPPLHYGMLALAYTPVRLLSEPAVVSHESKSYERLFLAGRLLSLAMGGLTVLLVQRCASLVVGRGASLFAALCFASSPTFVYYAKFANLDVPYLFWFALSLLCLLRFMRDGGTGAAISAAVAAALSIGTKDQAYALYPLLALAALLAVVGARRREGQPASLAALLRDERIRLPLAAALVLFAAAHNLLFNAGGFSDHLALIAGDASRDYRMFPPGAAGQWRLLLLSGRLLVFVLGEPATALALLGLLLAWRTGERLLLLTLLPLLSYQLLFLGVVGYAYDRFLLPHALVLSLFAGRAFAAARAAWLRGAAVAIVLGFGVLRCASLGLLLQQDARYEVERWFERNVPQKARIAVLGTLEYMPRLHGFQWKQRTELLRAVAGMDPDYVVVNADYAARAEDARARELYRSLDAGEAGYRLAFSARTRLAWPYRLDEYVRRRGDGLPTNLDKINPEIRVYARERGSAIP